VTQPTPPQAERVSRGLSDLNAAESTSPSARRPTTQVIGNRRRNCAPRNRHRYLPHSREEAIDLAFKGHPAVIAASFDVDVASTTIHVAESKPAAHHYRASNASHSSDADPSLTTFRTDQASILGQMTAPIYDGGTAASQTRQAKELAAQSRQVLDQVRNQSRTAATGAWVANEGAKVAVAASESEVRAAGCGAAGCAKRKRRAASAPRVDVLNSQQDLIRRRRG